MLTGRFREVVMLTGVVLTLAEQLLATDMVFTADDEISDGESFERVWIYDSPPAHTTIEMLGGGVTSAVLYDHSTMNLRGGNAVNILASAGSTVNTYDGRNGTLVAEDNATMNIRGGNVGSFFVEAREFSTVAVYGGVVVGVLAAGDSATIEMYGGQVGDCLAAVGTSMVNVYGHDFSFLPEGQDDDTRPVLTGIWENGVPFAITLRDLTTYEHLNLLPEPASLALLSYAAPMLLRRRPRRLPVA